MHKTTLFTLLCLVCLLLSCEKQPFSVNSPNREDVTIVYGLLDPAAQTHYLKIYKGFLTEGNAYEAAKDIHNYSYIDSIEVFLEEYAGEQLVRSIPLDTTTAIAKDSGTFAYPLQVLYTCEATLNTAYRYLLRIRNKYNGKIVLSETDLVGDIYLVRPIITLSKEISITEQKQTIRFKADNNIHYCEVGMIYYYTETLLDGTDRAGAPVYWKIGSVQGGNSTGTNGQEMSLSYQGYLFFQQIGSNIAADPDVASRHTDSIVIQIEKAGKELYRYMLASAATTGLNQERLTYTNIKSYASAEALANGKSDGLALGLFASKSSNRFVFRDLGKMSRDSLFYGRFTKHLKFTDIY